MTFTSWQFGAFVAVVFATYYLPPVGPFQVYLLVLSSLFFYGYGQAELLPMLALAVLGTYLFLLLAWRSRAIWLPVGIAFNLGLLAFFKYKFLFFDPLSISTGFSAADFLLRLPLPIGISFFVFHNISLLVDLTKDDRTRRPSLTEAFLYIIFFPQLVSGPITRAEMFLPQIKEKFLADVDFVAAAKWILTGYFFKLFVANNLNEMTAYMDFPLYETVRLEDKWLLVFLYSYQIYADFFGYTAIAIGLGLLFGYRLPINFNLPYISASFSEFWTRWHMSLSAWLRTYLYIPLGGNRHGKLRTLLNIMIVMALGGLWHGAALSYLAWGTMHGVLLVLERILLGKIDDTLAAGGCRPAAADRPCVPLRLNAVDFLQAPELRSCARLSVGHVHCQRRSGPGQVLQQSGADLRAAGDHPAPRACISAGGRAARGRALPLWPDGRVDVRGGRPLDLLHLFPVLTE